MDAAAVERDVVRGPLPGKVGPVAMDEQGAVTLGKALSTPDDFAIGAINAVADAARNLGLKNENELLASTNLFFHACTVADNTLITRTGPKTGLLTTAGFADTLLIMRGRTTEGLTESDAFRASTAAGICARYCSGGSDAETSE